MGTFGWVIWLGFQAFAGESGKAPNEAPKVDVAAAPTGTVQVVAKAAQLARWSRAEQSVEGLIAAAQWMASVHTQTQQAQKTARQIPGVDGSRDKDEATTWTLAPKDLLAEAQWYASASTDKYLPRYVDGVVKRGLTPSTDGTPVKYAVTRVSPGFVDEYEILFTGGELAEVAISGDGDTDLDLTIYDEFGNYIGSDTGATDDAYVAWTPRWTGKFRVEVRNPGTVHNQYVMITN